MDNLQNIGIIMILKQLNTSWVHNFWGHNSMPNVFQDGALGFEKKTVSAFYHAELEII